MVKFSFLVWNLEDGYKLKVLCKNYFWEFKVQGFGIWSLLEKCSFCAIVFQVITGFIVGNINLAIWEIWRFSLELPKPRELIRTYEISKMVIEKDWKILWIGIWKVLNIFFRPRRTWEIVGN